MPNPLNTQERGSQNGHYVVREVSPLSPPAAPNLHSVGAPSSPAPASTEDWSSLTKELIDTLPRVWTRSLLYLLIIFAGIVLPWAMLSRVDETGTARGRIEPQGKTLKLDVPVAGTVAAVKVKEGQTVKAGQTLLEMASEIPRTELQQTQAKLEGQLSRVIQLEFMKNQLEIAIRAQQQQSQAQQSAQQAEIGSSQQRLNFSKNSYALAKERLRRDLLEVKRYRSVLKSGIVPQITIVEAERAANESERLLNQTLSDAQQAQYDIKKQQSAYQNVVRTGQLTVLESERKVKEIQSQIGDARSEVAQTKKQIQSLQLQLQQLVFRAPTAGTIFQLAVENTGSVLEVGQTLAQIAPQGAAFVFRAQMPSGESGFLKVGMPVKLKFDAYPFQDYGVVPGRLRWISPDSKVVESPQGNIETFELEIIPDQTYIQSQNKRIALTPGQTATAEVIVRQRRLIDFILDPFKKLQKGGLDL